MTFWKTVGAYLTGWLIAQPTFAAVQRWLRHHEMTSPSDDLRSYWAQQAKAIVRELERHPPARRPLKVLYLTTGVAGAERHIADADIVYRESVDGLVLVKDRYGSGKSPTVRLEIFTAPR